MQKISNPRDHIENWKSLPLSLIGRVNAIRVMVLSLSLSVCANLSYASIFKTIDSIIMPFIWAYKPPRISKVRLQKTRSEGGLVDNSRHYYWACNARVRLFWLTFPPIKMGNVFPKWLLFERHKAAAALHTSLSALLQSKAIIL